MRRAPGSSTEVATGFRRAVSAFGGTSEGHVGPRRSGRVVMADGRDGEIRSCRCVFVEVVLCVRVGVMFVDTCITRESQAAILFILDS